MLKGLANTLNVNNIWAMAVQLWKHVTNGGAYKAGLQIFLLRMKVQTGTRISRDKFFFLVGTGGGDVCPTSTNKKARV